MVSKLFDINLDTDFFFFFGIDTKGQGAKAKITMQDNIKVKKKNSVQQRKALSKLKIKQPTEWGKKICPDGADI